MSVEGPNGEQAALWARCKQGRSCDVTVEFL